MNLNLKHKINFYCLIVFTAAVVYLTTAYNSHGFYHADEHYQIIEFAGLKIGTHAPNDLAWEFKAQIRPALQSTICFIIIKGLNVINIYDPYLLALALRLLSALIALLIIHFFIKETENQFVSIRIKKVYYLLSYFLWFIPVISVRFSSETWSGLLFLLALAVFFWNDQISNKPFKIGLLLGFSFLFRFQILFVILGFILWLILIKRVKVKYILKIGIAFILVFCFGFIIDSWFYSKTVFTAWNYFYVNIIENALDFGTYPWYYYLVKFISFPSYFIGIPLCISFIILLIYKPNNIFIWCIIPFIIIHSIIPHKEERFLFPVVFLFPIILILGYTQLLLIIKNKHTIRLLNYILLTVFITVNLIGLIAMSQKSAGIGRMEITKYIHDRYRNKKINLIYSSWANPYNPWQSLPVKFYLEKNMVDRHINNLCELNDSMIVPEAENLLVIRKIDLENQECSKFIQKNNFIFVKQSIPEWIEYLNQKYKGFENQNILMLYKYTFQNN